MFKIILFFLYCTLLSFEAKAQDVFLFVGKNTFTDVRTDGSAIKLGRDLYVTACHNLVGQDKTWIETPASKVMANKTYFYPDLDACFIGDNAQWTIKYRVPKVGEKISVLGFKDGQIFKSYGTVLSVDGDSFKVDAPWVIGVSGGAILSEDGELLGMAVYMERKGAYYVGVILSPSLLDNASLLNVRKINMPLITLYKNKNVIS